MPDDEGLPVPQMDETHSTEILRAWMSGSERSRELRITLRSLAFADPGDPRGGAAVWGVCLADIARHVAAALADDRDVDEGIALSDMARIFAAEIGSPTESHRKTFRIG